MHHFAYRDGVLHAEGVDLRRLADEVGTPFYCYSTATLERHYRVFAEAFADTDALVCYAMKANSNQAVLKTLGRLGAGMDIVSEGELRRALRGRRPGERIVFSGVGKTRPEMAFASTAASCASTWKSSPSSRRCPRSRSRRGCGAGLDPHQSRRGRKTTRRSRPASPRTSSASRFSRARGLCAGGALLGIAVTGVDMHIGSQITDLEPFDNATALLAELARDLMADGHRLHHIDLGGGLGVPYREDNEPPPDPQAYAQIIKRHTKDLGLKLVFEIGRMIAGNAGVLVARVIYVKERSGQDLRDRRRGHERPHPPDALRGLSRHAAGDRAGRQAAHRRRRGRPGLRDRRLSGAVGRDLPAVKAGDLLAVMTAGAYGAVRPTPTTRACSCPRCWCAAPLRGRAAAPVLRGSDRPRQLPPWSERATLIWGS